MTEAIRKAMILAAGLGTRMRPITDTLPKPLVKVDGTALIDHLIQPLAEAGVTEIVVNVHHLADLMERHLSQRATPRILISDERDGLLDSGGGVKKALAHFGAEPFFILNADSFWIDGPHPNLARMQEAWDPAAMDMLLLVAPTPAATGYDGRGDFFMTADGVLARRGESYDVRPGERRRDLAISIAATLYTIFMLYAAGVKFILLAAVLYAPGTILYVIARREQGKPVFTRPWDWLIFILTVLGAAVGIYWLATGYIKI